MSVPGPRKPCSQTAHSLNSTHYLLSFQLMVNIPLPFFGGRRARAGTRTSPQEPAADKQELIRLQKEVETLRVANEQLKEQVRSTLSIADVCAGKRASELPNMLNDSLRWKYSLCGLVLMLLLGF